MARYYDIDKLKSMVEAKAETLIVGKEAFLCVAKWLDLLPGIDAVPKSESEFDSIPVEVAQALKEKAVDKAKAEVAREIFEEIEQNIFGDGTQNLIVMTAKGFAELKKKYTGEKV